METELKNDNTKHNRKNLLDLRILDHRVDQRNGVAQDHRNHDLCLDESNKTQISKKKNIQHPHEGQSWQPSRTRTCPQTPNE